MSGVAFVFGIGVMTAPAMVVVAVTTAGILAAGWCWLLVLTLIDRNDPPQENSVTELPSAAAGTSIMGGWGRPLLELFPEVRGGGGETCAGDRAAHCQLVHRGRIVEPDEVAI
ncbi:hypothetical protein Rhow_002331 [Rhodococcus wratislaviensis]|uniref:Uncharacterized protein n=1 Tax=Rhodococcus wratislaviensis TaxID=44752 RepID=A0A402C5H4_RHOWR|nr:hypothetical protein Rhow_002331 [Rhodococcus wratislaviensis]